MDHAPVGWMFQRTTWESVCLPNRQCWPWCAPAPVPISRQWKEEWGVRGYHKTAGPTADKSIYQLPRSPNKWISLLTRVRPPTQLLLTERAIALEWPPRIEAIISSCSLTER